MTTTLLLIRHATHDRLDRVLCGRMTGVHLSEAGLKQARALGAHLATTSLSTIYSSPLERARETAEAIAERAASEIVVDERLSEVEFGRWTGLGFEELRQDPDWNAWNTERSRGRPPGGETIQDVQARLDGWIRELATKHPDQTVASVSHGDVIKAVVAQTLGSPIDRLGSFAIDPASVTRLEIHRGSLRLISLNITLS